MRAIVEWNFSPVLRTEAISSIPCTRGNQWPTCSTGLVAREIVRAVPSSDSLSGKRHSADLRRLSSQSLTTCVSSVGAVHQKTGPNRIFLVLPSGFHYATLLLCIHSKISSSRNNSVCPILWWGIPPMCVR